jgi:sterol desaturase/sphingolipid hydroxylase (fatty acid hydroxylase superfamily)
VITGTIGGILVAMVLVAVLETMVPLHARGRWHRRHLVPNLVLTALALVLSALLNVALVAALVWQERHRVGLLHVVGGPPLVAGTVAVVLLDFAFYVAHVAMHRIETLWRYHRVHHADPAVDVTTTIRQHPGESVVRYVFMAAFACASGASPGAFAVYRVWSALNGLLEHANVRMPLGVARVLSLVTTWPHVHKVHHSRRPEDANTNYGNIFSFFDRLFSTFTPSERGLDVAYGLDGFDDPATQSAAGLLAVPFRAA